MNRNKFFTLDPLDLPYFSSVAPMKNILTFLERQYKDLVKNVYFCYPLMAGFCALAIFSSEVTKSQCNRRRQRRHQIFKKQDALSDISLTGQGPLMTS